MPTADGEVRNALLELAPDANVEIRTGVRVGRIGPDLTVEAKFRGRSKRFRADVVLVATGRAPNLAGLGLGVAGVALERGAVRVNKFRQSVSAPHVYAAGDATGAHQHTPAAWYEGQLAADNALRGNRRVADFSVFPTATFTIPALAQVGLTEETARRSGARSRSDGRRSPTQAPAPSARRPRGWSRRSWTNPRVGSWGSTCSVPAPRT